MANSEHVALVRRGAEAIREWRRENPRKRLDLSEASLVKADLSGARLMWADLAKADLSGADLSGANLAGAELSEANLSRADLNHADLSAADLRDADLFYADLSSANLSEANLSWANLIAADLSGAGLSGANLIAANLSGADLSGAGLLEANLTRANLSGARLPQASLASTSLSNLDLSGAKGLRDVRHMEPSSIGVDTLIASFRGAGSRLTPELHAFFRGAGVPPELLDALPKIVSEIKYYSCFISYGQPDVEFATKLCQDLEARGVPCWLYHMDKTPGKRTWSEIGEARRGTDKFVVLCSAKALVRDGVLEEIEDQINDDPDGLVPISLDSLWKEPGFRIMRGTHDLKPDLVNRNYADFANKPYEEALAELLKGLKLEKPAVKKPRRKKG